MQGGHPQQISLIRASWASVVPIQDTAAGLVPLAQDMARRHVGYGVKAAHYDTVGTALLWTLEQGLGSAFTDETKTAWATAY